MGSDQDFSSVKPLIVMTGYLYMSVTTMGYYVGGKFFEIPIIRFQLSEFNC